MADLTKNAILLTVRDRAKRTKIWNHKGYKSQITNFFKNSKFYKKRLNGRLDQKCYLRDSERQSEMDEILDHKGYYT